jgi:coenzyme F420-0:L-glutamate ligase / coenzyme F420-1:gamma-L-glutamate ligase
MDLTLHPLTVIPLINKGDNIAEILLQAIDLNKINLLDNDILVITQKIISKAEGRQVHLSTIKPSNRALELAKKSKKDPRLIELILQESNEVLRVTSGHIIVEHKLGFVCANAGIDHSNVCSEKDPGEESYLLLPVDPERSVQLIRDRIKKLTGKIIGVIIIDSHGRAWRNGIIGTAIGVAGIPALVDLRGKEDIFGYKLKITFVAAADELAAAASLVMGQADEKIPAVHVRGFPYQLRESTIRELFRKKDKDLFR